MVSWAREVTERSRKQQVLANKSKNFGKFFMQTDFDFIYFTIRFLCEGAKGLISIV
jgi:hypothetical protein